MVLQRDTIENSQKSGRVNCCYFTIIIFQYVSKLNFVSDIKFYKERSRSEKRTEIGEDEKRLIWQKDALISLHDLVIDGRFEGI